MSKANEPVFPFHSLAHTDANAPHAYIGGGLSKREYFAAMAMQGVVHSWQQMGVDPTIEKRMANQIASRAVEFADALIAELEKSGKGK